MLDCCTLISVLGSSGPESSPSYRYMWWPKRFWSSGGARACDNSFEPTTYVIMLCTYIYCGAEKIYFAATVCIVRVREFADLLPPWPYRGALWSTRFPGRRSIIGDRARTRSPIRVIPLKTALVACREIVYDKSSTTVHLWPDGRTQCDKTKKTKAL